VIQQVLNRDSPLDRRDGVADRHSGVGRWYGASGEVMLSIR
jgi:hypothetical protein